MNCWTLSDCAIKPTPGRGISQAGSSSVSRLPGALALDPRVILFDEPTSALDPELVGEVLDVIKKLARSGTTLVVVTHEVGFAREVADQVVFMVDGRIVEQGSSDEVLNHPQHPRTRQFYPGYCRRRTER